MPTAEIATASEITNIFDEIGSSMTLSKLLNIFLLIAMCLVAMKVIGTVLDRTMTRLRVEPTVHKFSRSCLKVLLWLITVLIVASYIGIPVESLVTVLGIVGLALSLALQGILSNLAAGISVMLSKPFGVGDFVEAGGVSGTVSEIGLVYTKLQTVDNKIIFVPNGQISTEKIINYNTMEQRRVDLTFAVSAAADPDQVKKIMGEAVGAHPKALFTPEPFVRTTAIDYNGVSYTLRVWCAAGDYWEVYLDLLEQVRAAFGENGIPLARQNLNVSLTEADAGKSVK